MELRGQCAKTAGDDSSTAVGKLLISFFADLREVKREFPGPGGTAGRPDPTGIRRRKLLHTFFDGITESNTVRRRVVQGA
jgi:hypothetical protein